MKSKIKATIPKSRMKNIKLAGFKVPNKPTRFKR